MNIFLALTFTIFLEFFMYVFFIRKNFLKLFLYSILINSFTNPFANLAYSFEINIFLIEIEVFVVEIFLIKHLFELNYKKSILISLFANLVSFLFGFIFLKFF